MYLTYIIIERYIIGGYSFIKNAIVLGGRKLSLRILKTLICLGTILKLSSKLYESINNLKSRDHVSPACKPILANLKIQFNHFRIKNSKL